MQRPAGVIILAVLYWLSAFGLFVGGIILAVGFTAFGTMSTGMMSAFAGLGVIGGVLLIGFGAVAAFIGYGLIQLQEWARITTLVLVGIGLLMGFIGLVSPFGFGRLSSIVRIAIDGFILWYLLQPQVRASFRRA
jgi:hypothetical protein